MNKSIAYVFLAGIVIAATATASSPITSTGANPAWAIGGSQGAGSQTISLLTAPSDQDLLVTDVVFSITGYGSNSSSCVAVVTIQDNGGNLLASYRIASRDNVNYGGGISPTSISHSYRAGLPVSAGNTLEMATSIDCGGFSYSVAGLHVQP